MRGWLPARQDCGLIKSVVVWHEPVFPALRRQNWEDLPDHTGRLSTGSIIVWLAPPCSTWTPGLTACSLGPAGHPVALVPPPPRAWQAQSQGSACHFSIWPQSQPHILRSEHAQNQ